MTIPDGSDLDFDPLLRDAVSAMRAPVAARPSARAALRAALAAERAAAAPIAPARPVLVPRTRRWRWLTTSRPVAVSPLGMLAAASLLIAATAAVTARFSARGVESVVAAQRSGATPAGTQVVRFQLSAPNARHVALVGDFNDWDPSSTALKEQDGTWTVVIPVTPGRHQYGFVVDDSTWIADPQAPRTADTDFGSANSIVYVGS